MVSRATHGQVRQLGVTYDTQEDMLQLCVARSDFDHLDASAFSELDHLVVLDPIVTMTRPGKVARNGVLNPGSNRPPGAPPTIDRNSTAVNSTDGHGSTAADALMIVLVMAGVLSLIALILLAELLMREQGGDSPKLQCDLEEDSHAPRGDRESKGPSRSTSPPREEEPAVKPKTSTETSSSIKMEEDLEEDSFAPRISTKEAPPKGRWWSRRARSREQGSDSEAHGNASQSADARSRHTVEPR